MRNPAAVAGTALLVAVPAFALTPTLFPAPRGMAPTTAQMPFFLVLGAINSVALGLGVAFLAFGWPTMRRLVPSSTVRAVAGYLTIAWLLMSWYPHSGLHASNGMNTSSLLWIEYGFHVPLIAAPLVLLWALTGPRVAKDVPGVPISS